MRRLLALPLLAALAAGCGGNGGGRPFADAAEVVPADALAYVVVAPNSLGRARAALAQLRAPAHAFPYLREGTTAELPGGIVGFARPADEKRFAATLDRRGVAHATVHGWTVYAPRKELVDAVRHSSRALGENARFRSVFASLPSHALVRAYVPQRPWRAAALTADRASTRLEVRVQSPGRSPAASLADEIPAGAVVALSAATAALPAEAEPWLAELGRLVGADARPLVAALGRPLVAFVRRGDPVPEVTFAAAPPKPAQAVAAVGRFVRRISGGAAKPTPLVTPLGTLKEDDLGPISLVYGRAGGRVVVSDDPNVLAELGGGEKLAGNARFRAAAGAAGLGGASDAWLYVDGPGARSVVSGFAGLAGTGTPPAIEQQIGAATALLTAISHGDGASRTTHLRVR